MNVLIAFLGRLNIRNVLKPLVCVRNVLKALVEIAMEGVKYCSQNISFRKCNLKVDVIELGHATLKVCLSSLSFIVLQGKAIFSDPREVAVDGQSKCL